MTTFGRQRGMGVISPFISAREPASDYLVCYKLAHRQSHTHTHTHSDTHFYHVENTICAPLAIETNLNLLRDCSK